MDWKSLEQSARFFAGAGDQRDGLQVAELRRRVVGLVEEARAEVASEAGMPTTPPAELLMVDRRAWAGGNVRTLQRLFEGVTLPGSEAKLVAWEGGAFVGVLARLVLAQFDPFRNQLLVVHSNLGDLAEGDGLRYIVLHEVTHLAQFRAAPWIPDRIVELGQSVLGGDSRGWTKEVAVNIRRRLPEIVRWGRDALEGKAEGMPLIDMLPPEQRDKVLRLYSLVTLLEGHATLVTDLIAERVIPTYEDLRRRLDERKKRPPLVRLLEATAGIEMKRQQYVLGRDFCRAVWEAGGAPALAPAWSGPESVPTHDELRAPELWLKRVA
jgi:coenzyme F420 biosynthesis associated uncharacterized protein